MCQWALHAISICTCLMMVCIFRDNGYICCICKWYVYTLRDPYMHHVCMYANTTHTGCSAQLCTYHWPLDQVLFLQYAIHLAKQYTKQHLALSKLLQLHLFLVNCTLVRWGLSPQMVNVGQPGECFAHQLMEGTVHAAVINLVEPKLRHTAMGGTVSRSFLPSSLRSWKANRSCLSM